MAPELEQSQASIVLDNALYRYNVQGCGSCALRARQRGAPRQLKRLSVHTVDRDRMIVGKLKRMQTGAARPLSL